MKIIFVVGILMRKIKKITKWCKAIPVLAFVALTSGCGSEDGIKGVLGSIPIFGVSYEGDLGSIGATSEKGEFFYQENENITFSIGGLVLGSHMGVEHINALMMTPSATSATDTVVNNKVVFLQSIDADASLNNGIQITQEMSEVISQQAQSLDFNQNNTDFSQNLTALLDELESQGLFSDTTPRPRTQVSTASATELFDRAMSERNTVKTKYGELKGYAATDTTWQYLGVPYAEAPIGELRWKEPKKLKSWKGVRDAVAWSDQSAQNPALQRFGEGGMSEDSLYLNITAPKDAQNLPVMVWFHGGGFTALTSNTKPFNNPESLVTKGVIQVSVNHRLGPFGYIAHPQLSEESEYDGSGNYGQMDLIAALEWVQKNIEVFGGDKNNVTIFGESGGGRKVLSLMASPKGKKLFHKAISQSGTLRPDTRTLAEAEAIGEQLQENLGAANIAEMREKPWTDIVQAASALQPYTNIDNYYIPKSERELFESGKNNDVPFMFLINTNDTPEPNSTVLNVFPWMASLTKASHFATLFSHQPAGWKSRGVEAYHAAELAYLFNYTGSVVTHYQLGLVIDPTTDALLEVGDLNQNGVAGDPTDIFLSAGFNQTDTEVVDNMMTIWTNFAKTGDPSIEGKIEFPVYDDQAQMYVEVSETLDPKSNISSRF